MRGSVDAIQRLAKRKGLFRERDVEREGVSPSCLEDARVFGLVTHHGHGVWSDHRYEPTRYELVQIRLEHAVFWGPSALWLHGVTKQEPDAIWIAIGHKSRRPRTLPLETVIVRSRHLEKDVVTVTPRLLDLRVHTRERAEADIAQHDSAGLIGRSLRQCRFNLERDTCFLSSQLRAWPDWRPWPEPPGGYYGDPVENWSVVRSIPSKVPEPSAAYRRLRK